MMSLRRSRSGRTGEAGQGLVEIALVLPVFILVIAGIFDVGMSVFTNSSLSQAAREGARLAAAEAGWIGVSGPACIADESVRTKVGQHVCPETVGDFKAHVVDAVNRMTATLGPVNAVYVSCNAGDSDDPVPSGDWTESVGGNGCTDGSGGAISASGDIVSVRIDYTYNTFTPIINSFLGSLPLSATASMIIN